MPVEQVQLTDDALYGLTVSDGHYNAVATLPQTVKLGYKPAKARPQAPRLSAYMQALHALSLPASVDNYTKAALSIARMYRNDVKGCCVVAGKGHLLGVWSTADSDSGPVVLMTDAEVDQQYASVCGPGDNGCYIPDVLDYMKSKGLQAGGKRYLIAGYASVDWKSKELVQTAIAAFGGCTIGFNLPSAWTNSAIWDLTNTRIVGGHDVTPCGYGPGFNPDADGGGPKRVMAGYRMGIGKHRKEVFTFPDDPQNARFATGRVIEATPDGVVVSSWGRLYLITWPAFTSPKYITEMYVLVPAAGGIFFGADKKSPLGLDMAGLMSDMDKLGSGDIPPLPEPTPVVPPIPDPPPIVVPPVVVVPPVPPVSPPPVPSVIPNFSVTLTGNFPTGLLGTMTPVTLTGSAFPQASQTAAPQPLSAVSIPLLQLLAFAARVTPIIIADVQAGKSFQQIVQDVLAAIAPQMADEDRERHAVAFTAIAQSRSRAEWLAIATQIVQFVLALFGLKA